MKKIKNGKNGNALALAVTPVGPDVAVVAVEDGDAKTIGVATNKRKQIQEMWGAEEERHHNARIELIKMMTEANTAERTVINTVAPKYGINLEEAWSWNRDSKNFQRAEA